jgi:hypothetical protein
MGIILVISFIVIVAVGIANREEVILSIRSGSTNLKIGIFTLITGIIILLSGKILGFGELPIFNQIISICFLITFLCLIIGIFKFISLTSFSFNRKIGIFSLITGFAFAFMVRYFPFFYTLLPVNFSYGMITFVFYIVAVFSLIVEVYKFIFSSPSKKEKLI